MTDYLMCDQRIEVRVSHHHYLAIWRLQHWCASEFARFLGKLNRESRQRGILHQLVAPTLGEGFESALLADGVVDLLVTAVRLRDYITVTLCEGEFLRDQRAR